MKWFYNMKISKKIIISITAIAVIGGLLIGSVGFLYINKINNLSKLIYKENIAPLTPIYKVEADFLKVRNSLRDMALSKSQDKSQYVNTINDLYKDLNNNLSEYDKYISSNEEDQNYKVLKSDVSKYGVLKDKIINLIQSNQLDSALALMNGDGSTITNELDASITKAFDLNNKQADDRNKMNLDNGSRAELLMFGIVLLAVVMSILIGLFVSKMISKPLNKILDAANNISSGNLNVDLNIDSKDEVGILVQAFKKIVQSLKNLITDSNMLAAAAVDGKLNTRVDANKHNGDYRKIVEDFNSTLDSVIEPLNEANAVLGKMSVNDFTVKMDINQKGEFVKFSNSINTVQRNLLNAEDIFIRISKGDISRLDEYKQIGRRSENDKLIPSAVAVMESIQELIDETVTLSNNAINGNLSSRANAGKFQGGYKELVEGFNKTLEAIAEPINDSMIVLEKFSLNDYTINMSKNYKGDFNIYANSINDLHKRLLVIQRAFNDTAKGDISQLEEMKRVGRRCENDQLLPALIEMMETNKNLFLEVQMLTNNAIEGKLDVRGDSTKFRGNNKTIVDQINKLIDELNAPLNEANKVLNKMSLNDLSVQMSGNYKGMLKEFSDAIENVHQRLSSIQALFIDISNGNTSSLEELRKLGRRSENDRLLPAIITMMETIQELISESSVLVDAAVNGNLSIRGNADKFKGGYREVIQGINKTMDAVVKPIEEASNIMQKMAEGDLTFKMNEDYKGEYAKMKDSLNFTISFFNDVLNEINNSATEVASGSRQVSDGSQALSQGATEQASSVEELTVSINEVAAQTKENAVNANQANELALKAKENAKQGNEHMGEMLKSMQEINESSSNISKIIKVIDEIAFQTNILALNAAVEAARAGQHGKGFAVVAEEVRNLAARSANAAKETTGLIEGSIIKVEAGTEIANATAKALNEIVEGVAKSANFVGEIASASNEQAAAIAQINKGVEQVSQVVQTNSATAEESAAASEELSSQSQILKEMVSKFRLNSTSSKNSAYEKNKYTNKGNYMDDVDYSYAEAAVTSNKPKIALSDSEFGKY
ncbi:methyl-accepting chemotaxis protein [Clostridium scatologenes]|uniref:Methyl-accepting chemotaxis sensory transducer n=1 Tax=Clostridium scatologenes TaxID=1548 RepID=A0A0E3M679_CLOSL|nr:methyl-accepting chemotaxis protein [Clostridium scatologenes]AKA67265.1 methyl-accepting chemotaxis sensory transducer [Clostridium scatologenes]